MRSQNDHDIHDEPRPALLLDRDGVINVDKHYVHRKEDVEFVDGIFELCRMAKQAGMLLVVVTNQAGIGRGYYTEEDFFQLTDWMRNRFESEMCPLVAVYHCPYHPEHGIGSYRRESFDRKPNPGMILRARDELHLALDRSILVGDNITDIMAAAAAGVGKTVLVSSAALPRDAVVRPTIHAASVREVAARLFPAGADKAVLDR